jgi:DNA-binding MarR family transcriptional regulator
MLASRQISFMTTDNHRTPTAPGKPRHQRPDQQQQDQRLHPEMELASRLRVAIGRLSRRLRPTATGTAAGLTPTRTAVLLRIVREGPLRLSELSESEGINPTMLSRTIAALLEAGLVERTADEQDRRAAWVRSSAKGNRLAERIRRERTDAVKLALAALSQHDRDAIVDALPALEAFGEQLREPRR